MRKPIRKLGISEGGIRYRMKRDVEMQTGGWEMEDCIHKALTSPPPG